MKPCISNDDESAMKFKSPKSRSLIANSLKRKQSICVQAHFLLQIPEEERVLKRLTNGGFLASPYCIKINMLLGSLLECVHDKA